MAMRLCRNHAEAEDLVQDLCVHVLRKTIPISIGDLNAWLATSLKNMFIDRCRSKARHPSHESLDDQHRNISQLGQDTAEPAWSQIEPDDVRLAVDDIKPPYRDVYKLHCFDHLSYEQIAQQLGGITKTTVGTRLNRARNQLRVALANRFGFEADDGEDGDGDGAS